MSRWDVAVIGAGVVGLASAARLAARGLATLVIERHGHVGAETTSRSSQVVHAGMYYAPGTLKAELCVRGNASLGAWCEARGVPFARVGKLIVANDAEGEAELERILARGLENGCEDLGYAPRTLLAEEPNVVARAALWSPRSGIVDVHALMGSLSAAARGHGCDVALGHSVLGVARDATGYELRVRDPGGDVSSLRVSRVVNAAGLAADDVSALAGIDVDAAGYRQRWVKGSWFRVRGRGLVSRLVYPTPPADLSGLGIHVTLDLAGELRLGPDVEVLPSRRLDYAVDETRRSAFFAAASRYLPGLREDDLSPDQAGIRPKLSLPGEVARDFILSEESDRGLPGWITLLGIESPGLTCALELADRVASRLA